MISQSSNISVVITCFREGELLFDAVESIRTQTLLPLEIVLVNDASTHAETNRVCTQLAKDPLVRLITRTSNGGTSMARNDGFAVAQGAVIVPLDGDDLLPSQAIEAIQLAFDQNTNLDFLYGHYLREDQPGHLQEISPQNISLSHMLKAQPWHLRSQWSLIGTTPLRKSIWEAVQGYDPLLGVEDLHDVDFWIRVLAQSERYLYLNVPIYHWRKYLGNNSRKVTPLAWYKIAKKNFEIYRKVGLEYRAYELLLLGSKWLRKTHESRTHTVALIQCIFKDSLHISSLITLLLPTRLLHIAAQSLQKNR